MTQLDLEGYVGRVVGSYSGNQYGRRIKTNLKMGKRKLFRKITKEGIKKYAISEIPGSILGFFSAAGTAEIVKKATGSDYLSAACSTLAGDTGFFVGKTISYGLLHHKDYLSGNRSFSRDLKNLGKSVGVAAGLDLMFIAPLQYLLQDKCNMVPYIASAVAGTASIGVTGVRWSLDYAQGMANNGLRHRKNKQKIQLEEKTRYVPESSEFKAPEYSSEPIGKLEEIIS